MSRKKINIQYIALGILLLCVFANPLERISPFFGLTDELLCLGACIAGAVLWLPKPELRRQIPKHLLYFIPFFLYMFMQLLGNLIYQYQPWKPVVIDALTNAKFWLTLYGCYLISRLISGEDVERGLLIGAKAVSAILFVLFLLEQFWIIFPDGNLNEKNQQIQCTQMMYYHPSYAAAVLAFLLAILLSNWNVKLLPYISADLLMMVFTFRTKAYGGVVAFVGLLLLVVVLKQKIRIWHMALVGVPLFAIAWPRIILYFGSDITGEVHPWVSANPMLSARSSMLGTSIQILRDYFPLGTGFASFGSHQSVVQYSPIYYLYGLDTHPAVGVATRKYVDDSFWPIVFAQSGAIGLLGFLSVLLLLCVKAWKLFEINRKYYASALFCIAYMMITSIAEPTFNNITTLPLALLLGFWFGQMDQAKKGNTP